MGVCHLLVGIRSGFATRLGSNRLPSGMHGHQAPMGCCVEGPSCHRLWAVEFLGLLVRNTVARLY
jgi:hypothetical protein